MEALFILGRLLYGGFFIMNGIDHFRHKKHMMGYASSKGVPNPKWAVLITGVMILFGGLGILLGVAVKWSIIFIAIFLIGVSFKMHNFWKVDDPQAKQMEKIQFTKNIALLGADLMFFMIDLPWALSLF